MRFFQTKATARIFIACLIVLCALVVIMLALVSGVFFRSGGSSTTQLSAGKDCGSSRQCFYDSYSRCESAHLKTVQQTAQGDPIEIGAEIQGSSDRGCKLYIVTDHSKDRFVANNPALPKVTTDNCYHLQLANTTGPADAISLNASGCEDQSRGDARSI